MKLWKKPHMMEDHDPTQKGQKGWDVYCQIGEDVMKHWFTSPQTTFNGCIAYLRGKGIWKVNTEKRLKEFRKLWKILFLTDVCMHCGNKADYLPNPFMEDVHGKIEYEWLCDECYQKEADEI